MLLKNDEGRTIFRLYIEQNHPVFETIRRFENALLSLKLRYV